MKNNSVKSVLDNISHFFAGNTDESIISFVFSVYTKINIDDIPQNTKIEITITAKHKEKKRDVDYYDVIESYFSYLEKRYDLNISSYFRNNIATLDDFIFLPEIK